MKIRLAYSRRNASQLTNVMPRSSEKLPAASLKSRADITLPRKLKMLKARRPELVGAIEQLVDDYLKRA